jgi:cytochrome P450
MPDARPGLEALPKASASDVITGVRRYFRPGTARSPLRRLGDRFVVDLPGVPTIVMTCAPEDAKAILANRDGALSLGPVLHRWTPHPVLFGADSLIFLEGDAHARERRRLSPPFHGEMMTSYEHAMVAIAERLIPTWTTGTEIAFQPLAQQFVLEVMRTVVFGVSRDDRMRRLADAMGRYCRIVESDAFLALGVLGVAVTGRWRRYPPHERAAAAVDAIVLEEIAERRAAGFAAREDFLALLLAANAAEDEPKDDATLARDLRGLMLAGYETTAVTLASIADLLVHHPETLSRVQAGVAENDHRYLDAAILEAMRLRPAFPFTGRRALADFDLNGIRIPARTMLVISIMAVHERAELYPEPRAFRPERFMDARPGTYTWLAFGGGPHRCLGAAFALFESRVFLRTLLQARTLRAARPGLRPPRRSHPMIVPDSGAPVVLEPRETLSAAGRGA